MSRRVDTMDNIIARESNLGEVLKHMGLSDDDRLAFALEQKKGDELIGQAMERLGMLARDDLTAALTFQKRLRAAIEAAIAAPVGEPDDFVERFKPVYALIDEMGAWKEARAFESAAPTAPAGIPAMPKE